MESGHICFLDYDERPKIWHTRVLLAPTTADCWVILTPDHDIYEEQLSLGNPDVIDFHYGGADGNLAPRIAPASVYSFQPLTPAELAQFVLQGRVQANAIRAVAGLPPLGPGGHAAPGPPVAAVPAPPPVVPAAGNVEDTWIAADDCGRFKRGDIVVQDPNPLPPGCLVLGNRALMTSDAITVVLKKVPASEVSMHRLQDLRILPVSFDAQGQRRREFNTAVSIMDGTAPQGGGLQLKGPATVLNMLKGLRDQNFTPATYHEHWVRVGDIPRGDRSVYEHECLSRVLEALITIDQVNAPALQGVELICRRLQVIREAHRVSPGQPDYSAADHIMGWKYKRSAQIDMDLAQHVATELKNEAAIAKEARKAKEEQSLRRPNPKKNAKGEGAKDQ